MNIRVGSIVVALFLMLVGYLAWSDGEQRRIVRSLDLSERHTVFENTLHTYRTMCLDSLSEAFQRYCETQRDFLELFPECGTDCVRLLAKVERGPTR